MTVELSNQRLSLDDDVQLSYFLKGKGRKTRIGHARLVDLSEAGLCMEVSSSDSDLFLESQGRLFATSTNVEMQIFCRSHPMNLSVAGSIKWYKRKKELGLPANLDDVYVGVMFPLAKSHEKKAIVDLVRHLKKGVIKCNECSTVVSSDAVLCYNCGTRPLQKRSIFKKLIFNFLTSDERGTK